MTIKCLICKKECEDNFCSSECYKESEEVLND